MSAIFDAYNLELSRLPELYRRLNKIISYPDGMTTSLGIIYWGREEHYPEIESAIKVITSSGVERFGKLLDLIHTPAQTEKVSKNTGISKSILRILAHDIKLWLPVAVPLEKFESVHNHPEIQTVFTRLGLMHQLDVISVSQTSEMRQQLSNNCGLSSGKVSELVRLCDFYRMGKNLEHIRSRLYFQMGLDTYDKWAAQTSEGILKLFSQYLLEHNLEDTRLVPWPKEVRNGIEWARMHLEMFAVQW